MSILGEYRSDYPKDLMRECNKTKIMNYGWRLVRKKGFVIAYGNFWYSEKLLPYAGRYVVVSAVDNDRTEVNIFKRYPPHKETDLIVQINFAGGF